MKKIFASLLILTMILAAGCVPQEKAPAPSPEQTAQPGNTPLVPGGYMYLPVYHFDTWNPIMTKSLSVTQVSALVYEGLFKRVPDMSMEPCLAQSYSVSGNALTYTFTLRSGVKWHDGSDFGAQDVEYTIREIMKHDSIYKHNVDNIASTHVINSDTYTITLKKPMAGFVALLDFPVIKNNTNDLSATATYMPMGTGYYRYAESHMGKTLTLKAIGSHWSGKAANVDTVTVKQLPDKEAVKYAFDAGEVDVMYQAFSEMMAYSPKHHVQSVSHTNNNMTFLGINTTREVLAGANTRKAVSMAIDRLQIASGVMVDRVKPAVLPINPDSWLMPENAGSIEEDYTGAKELLALDGWSLGESGVLQKKEGNVATIMQFSVLVNEDNLNRVSVLESIKKNMSDIGISLNIEKVSFEQYQKRVSAGNYDMFIGEVGLPAEYDLSDFIGEKAAFCVYKSGNMDALLQNVNLSAGNAELKTSYGELARGFAEEVPVIALFFSMDALIYSNRVKGSVAPAWGNVFGNIAQWYAN